ncbi:hypothetical protein XELAEV_18000282mg [Xenopus laevis]|uniref:T-cell receptor alpha chain constant domain-containing protein n=1 Tax=Xenopus laevis TaxID=8355 RepID=A0A974GZH5_XENLA|nr:hypothetical protein XELAEV_18000282mg [Xenopus laevis]
MCSECSCKALNYCASTGSYGKLIFGQGTQLKVIPIIWILHKEGLRIYVYDCANTGYAKLTFGTGTQLVVLPIRKRRVCNPPYCLGVYHCAYGGGNDKLTFGSGTKLIVKPGNKIIFGGGTFLTVLPRGRHICTAVVRWHSKLLTNSILYCVNYGASNKLIFGSGTKINVKPNIKDAKPSMYRLKADTNEPGVPESVCLVTDFPVLSNETELQLNGIKVNKDERLLLDKTEDNTWRYSSVLWNDDAKTECTVNYASNKISEIPVAEKIECSSPKIDETFKTDERLNTVSLKMLGLRFLTIKAIVFNAITTQRLWSA